MIRIRPTTSIRRFAALDARLFPDDAPPAYEGQNWFLGTHKGDVACYAGYRLIDDGKTAFLTRAGVSPPYQGKGLQKKLIKARLRHAKEAGAEQAITYVIHENVASLNSLIAVGFSFYEPEEAYDGGPFLYLRKKL